MKSETLYLKLEKNVELQKDDVYLKDLGKCFCREESIQNRVRAMKIFSFQKADAGRRIVSVMYLIALLQKEFPNLQIENVGEAEVVVKRVKVFQNMWIRQGIPALFVCGICFFGSAFTIIAFHNDISIGRVFERIHELVTGKAGSGLGVLEISYSLGLAVGIILFFNHIGGRRITKDPTPIEVEMRIYEDQVNTALVETADREGKTLDIES